MLIRKRDLGRLQPIGCGHLILVIIPVLKDLAVGNECWRARTVVLEDHDVARLEGGRKELFDIGVEALAVDRSVEQAGRFDAVVAQRGEEGRGLPLALRNLVDGALSLRGPAAQTGHVGLRPGLVDEDQPSGVDEPLIGSPSFAVATYVRAILLARDEGLFLNVTPIRRKKRLIIEVSALTPRSDKRRSQSA